ncbi:putative WRKY transcription factor 30 [Zea mays]|uniref:Putative WRKY transcription factor 30 n=1 Tax=Zea mays TaxID=4577 RepID=A0A1D6N885_MAIZE|nr:putative WRKY transcription factor 30 [Zea mays]
MYFNEHTCDTAAWEPAAAAAASSGAAEQPRPSTPPLTWGRSRSRRRRGPARLRPLTRPVRCRVSLAWTWRGWMSWTTM